MAAAVTFDAKKMSSWRALRSVFGSQEAILLLCLIALLIAVGMINPRYVAERNLSSIFLGNAYIAVAAIGMSMVIISGNIDISVGSLIGVLATVSGSLAVNGYPIVVCWLAPLFVGALVTGMMGFLVAYLRIPSIVVSLGMLSILKGGLISVTAGVWISDLPAGYALAQMRPLGVPMPIYFMIFLTAGVALWMRYSVIGRSIYAVGGNAAARGHVGEAQPRRGLSIRVGGSLRGGRRPSPRRLPVRSLAGAGGADRRTGS